MSEIWRRRHELSAARRKKMQEAMHDYDENIYLPTLRALIAECAAKGHIKGELWNNGLGWSWYNCTQCGGRIEETVEHHDL